MAVRISSGTSQSSDSLEVHIDMPQPDNASVKARTSHDEAQTVKDTSEDSECLYEGSKGHYEPRKRYNISAILREGGFR